MNPARRPLRPACVGLQAAALAGILTLTSCAVLPPRQPQRKVPAAPTVQHTAQKVEMTGPRGRLSRPARQQILSRLAAEGKTDLLSRHLAVMSEAGGLGLYTGNEAQLLVDGPATFSAMFAAIESARRTVYLESYIVEDQAIAQQMADLLVRKRQQGLDVRMIYDSVGSISTSAEYFQRLRDQGVPVCNFNPLNPLERPGYWDISHRDHRKILSVDGEIAFTGGINVSEVYSASPSGSGGSGSLRGSKGPKRPASQPAAAAASAPAAAASAAEEGWRDTQIRLRGPAAAALEVLQRETWNSQGCQPAMSPAPTAPPGGMKAAGDKVVRIIPASPDDPESLIYASLLSAIDTSQRSVHLTMAYFAPGQDMVDALADAARRGVEVSLILPSVSDFGPVLHAGRARYTELLQAGVRIHELQDAVLHAKTAVIDGVVSTVGSSNLDWRSFTANNEVNAVVLGEDFGQQMEAMFRRDLADSQEITLAGWQRRPLDQRMKEWFALALERWW